MGQAECTGMRDAAGVVRSMAISVSWRPSAVFIPIKAPASLPGRFGQSY